DTGDIAGGRCAVSNDALDSRFACSGNAVGHIVAESTLGFLRGILATAVYFCPPSRSCVPRSARSGPRFFRSLARKKDVESRGSGERETPHIPIRIASEFSVQRI